MSQSVIRVSKPAFVGTSSALLGICLVAALGRFYVRFVVQRAIGWDDGWLIFGICCLIAGMAVIYTMVDLMYEMEAIISGPNNIDIPDTTILPPQLLALLAPIISKSVRHRKLAMASMVPLWGSMCSVKFSFLALFKKLLKQMPNMMRYWWFALAFNIIIGLYGVVVFIVACPYFEEKDIMKSLQCTSGDRLTTTLNHSTAHMILDIAGDIFIVVIPITLLWQIRIRLSQKIALAFTLCLTIVTILTTVVRLIGLRHKSQMDYIWTIFFMVVGAEVGLIMVAITAFRALYVSKVKVRGQQTIATFNWYHKSKSAFLKIIGPISGKPQGTRADNIELEKGNKDDFINGNIPRGTITGIHTFIYGIGNKSVDKPGDHDNRPRV
ncbi:hypothetical protein P280DRAFT_473831 [Massarina eburnea CBS 473.64]|uniref:Rhodopsin domain-containing protein n=1 Tax=Massarina eburnea CBS 473.64 TaxID=1395130 RepID=A0A6A6RLR1_9PLEO|nr:hypothetical protein P280DRAFT_473831 [Massarina eburnea CBS 473.64]